MKLDLRAAMPSDANELIDIDLKTSNYPWEAKDWNRTGLATSVATYYNTPVGFAVFQRVTDEVMILKLGVRKAYRRQGASLLLLSAGIHFAKNFGLSPAKSLSIIIPETKVLELKPWIVFTGFRASHVVRDCFKDCGILEDGIKFTKETT